MPRFGLHAVLVWLLITVANTAGAIDGVLEINQACAVSTGCFSGDVATFPVTLTSSGSYRLTSDLSVTAQNTSGIVVSADDVTIDMNGFTLSGPVTCSGSGSAVTCEGGNGFGNGVEGLGDGLVLHDGLVRGFESIGVFTAERARLRNLRVEGNGFIGIDSGRYSISSRCNAFQNGAWGITAALGSIVLSGSASSNRLSGIAVGIGSSVLESSAFANGETGIQGNSSGVIRGNTIYLNEGPGMTSNRGSVIADNSVHSNGADGIVGGTESTIHGNSVDSNTGVGLDLFSSDSYRENTINSNGVNSVVGGVDTGANSCNGATSCP